MNQTYNNTPEDNKQEITRALIIKKPWLDLILSGEKTWEIRGSNTKIRGRIGLIESGSGLIVGECDLYGSETLTLYQDVFYSLHKIPKFNQNVKYKVPHAWKIENATRYEKPIPYDHPKGAVIWVKLK